MKFFTFLFLSLIFLSSCKKDKIEYIDFQFVNGKPSEQGINIDTLSKLITKIKGGNYGNVHSLLIVKNDKLVVEEYFNGSARDSLHNLYSVTKAFTSALVGIAIDKGYISTENELITNCFPNYPIENPSTLKSKVTLANLLSMTSGYNWSPFYSNAYLLESSPNLIKDLYNSPVSREPSLFFAYTDLSYHLLSGVVHSKTGKIQSDFAAEHLFNFIGIHDWKWNADHQGVSEGASELYMRAIDLLKFGYLYLKRGKIYDNQVISDYWISESTKPRINAFTDFYFCYEWQKYRTEHTVVKTFGADDVYCARGRGDQFVWVCPRLNMVVVSTAMNDGTPYKSQPMFWEYILKMTR